MKEDILLLDFGSVNQDSPIWLDFVVKHSLEKRVQVIEDLHLNREKGKRAILKAKVLLFESTFLFHEDISHYGKYIVECLKSGTSYLEAIIYLPLTNHGTFNLGTVLQVNNSVLKYLVTHCRVYEMGFSGQVRQLIFNKEFDYGQLEDFSLQLTSTSH